MAHRELTPERAGAAPSAAVTPATLLGAAGLTLGALAFVAAAATLWFRHERDALKAERGWTATPAETTRVQDSQRERLSRYEVLDRANGVVAIPIERAMRLVVDESAKRPEDQR